MARKKELYNRNNNNASIYNSFIIKTNIKHGKLTIFKIIIIIIKDLR